MGQRALSLALHYWGLRREIRVENLLLGRGIGGVAAGRSSGSLFIMAVGLVIRYSSAAPGVVSSSRRSADFFTSIRRVAKLWASVAKR